MSIKIRDLLNIMPTTSITLNPQPYPYPPPFLVKHPYLYFDDADLFISQQETLYGLHRRHFETSFFISILANIKPGGTTARGTVPSLPILINNISIFTFVTFVSLLYRPLGFQIHDQGWKNIEDLAEKWNFPHIVLRAMEARQELDMRCYVPHQRLM